MFPLLIFTSFAKATLKSSLFLTVPPAIALCAAKTQGRAPPEHFSPPKSRGILYTCSAALPNAITALLSESGHFLAISRANRGGTCALINTCAGGLALWRITSLELTHGCPALEAGPNSALLRRGQNLGLVSLNRADFCEELARSATSVLGDITSRHSLQCGA